MSHLRALLRGRLFNRGATRAPLSRRVYVETRPIIADHLLRIFGVDDELVIFDIGACEAEDSVRYARLFPNARVFAVEPIPTNVAMAAETIARYAPGRVTLLPYAFSDLDGEVVMHVSSGRAPEAGSDQDWDYGNKSSSLLEPAPAMSVHPWLEFNETISVRSMTVQTACREMGVDRVDFIHLDVQGAELMVLAGAGSLLKSVRAIWLEVEAIPLYHGQPLRDTVADFLVAHGFSLRLDTVDDVSGDQLWVGTGLHPTETK